MKIINKIDEKIDKLAYKLYNYSKNKKIFYFISDILYKISLLGLGGLLVIYRITEDNSLFINMGLLFIYILLFESLTYLFFISSNHNKIKEFFKNEEEQR